MTSRSEKPKILIVDDEPANLLGMKLLLKSFDATIMLAESGDRALELFSPNDTALIIMDLQMPGMDGLETSRALRKKEGGQDVPIIFATATDRDDKRALEGYGVGAVDFIFKPVEPTLLRAKIATFLEMFRLRSFREESLKLKVRHEAIAAEAEKLKNILNHIPMAIAVADAHTKNLTFANNYFEPVLKHSFQPGTSISDSQIFTGLRKDGSKVELSEWPLARSIAEGEVIENEQIIFLAGDGKRIVLDISSAPIFNDKNEIVSGLATFRDVTLRYQMEDELHRQQKLQAIGQLASGVAHEFNNALQAIKGLVSFARREVSPDSPAYDDLDKALQAVDRAASISRRLLMTARDDKIKKSPCDAGLFLKNFASTVSPMLGDEVNLQCVFPEDSLTVSLDDNSMMQALINLCINARDAMPEGGIIRVKALYYEECELFIRDPRKREYKGYVCFVVEDTGQGMDEIVRDRIFEPFFTTKDPGKGTGLGLPAVHNIILQHGGKITVDSVPGKGTSFFLWIPRTNDNGCYKSQPQAGRAQKNLQGQGTILIAEDQPEILDIMERTLTGGGYKVIKAVNGIEAVAEFSRHKAYIDLIVIDGIMPLMNGMEVFERIRRLEPAMPVIFCTGYSSADNETIKQLIEKGLPILAKPFEPEQLLKAVKNALEHGVESLERKNVS